MRADSCNYQQNDIRGSNAERYAQYARRTLVCAMGVDMHLFSLRSDGWGFKERAFWALGSGLQASGVRLQASTLHATQISHIKIACILVQEMALNSSGFYERREPKAQSRFYCLSPIHFSDTTIEFPGFCGS